MKRAVYKLFDFSEEDKALFELNRKAMDEIKNQLVEEMKKEIDNQILTQLHLLDPNWEVKVEFDRLGEREEE